MCNGRMLGRVLLGALWVALPMSVQAGFGFGFDSDNGFYDYDPEDYPWWGGYPPPGYRDYNPGWRWGSERHSSGWRWGSERPGSGWRWGDDSKHRTARKHERGIDSWWHSRRLKDRDSWSSWGREWSFGRDNGDPVKLNFGSFDWGDHWSPSFGRKSWRFGHKPRWYPRWGYPPPAPYRGWGVPYAAPAWGANPYGAVTPYAPPAGASAPTPAPGETSASQDNGTPETAASSGEADSQPATAGDSGSSAQAQQTHPKQADAESH